MSLIFSVFFLFFAEGAFGFETDGVKSLSVMEGDSVTLHTCLSDIQKYAKFLWNYGPKSTPIAEFNTQNKLKPVSFFDGEDGRFRDRLNMDFETGSLTIKNIRTNHSGIYSVRMISTSAPSSARTFNVTVTGVFDPDAGIVKHLSVKEGASVTLKSDVNLQKDHLLVWKYSKVTERCVYNRLHQVPCLSDASIIARIYGETQQPSYDAGEHQIFHNRLKMDEQSGSLTIENISPENSGFYMLEITNNTGTRHRRFNVTVSEYNSNVWKCVAIVLLVVSVVLVLLLCLAVIVKKKKTNVLSRCRSKREQQQLSSKPRSSHELDDKTESQNLETSHSEEDQRD